MGLWEKTKEDERLKIENKRLAKAKDDKPAGPKIKIKNVWAEIILDNYTCNY